MRRSWRKAPLVGSRGSKALQRKKIQHQVPCITAAACTECGVPQGSVLGRLLLCTCTRGLTLHLLKAKHHLICDFHDSPEIHRELLHRPVSGYVPEEIWKKAGEHHFHVRHHVSLAHTDLFCISAFSTLCTDQVHGFHIREWYVAFKPQSPTPNFIDLTACVRVSGHWVSPVCLLQIWCQMIKGFYCRSQMKDISSLSCLLLRVDLVTFFIITLIPYDRNCNYYIYKGNYHKLLN